MLNTVQSLRFHAGIRPPRLAGDRSFVYNNLDAMANDVVITGMGIVSPIGIGEGAFWNALCQGRSAAAPVDGLDTTNLPRKIACQIREPIDVDVVQPIGRASKLAVVAARQAVSSAGLKPDDLRQGRVDIIVGTTMGETEFIEERLGADEAEWLSPDHTKRIALGRPGCIARSVQADMFGSPPLERLATRAGMHVSARAKSLSQKVWHGFATRVFHRLETGATGVNSKARGSALDLYGACAAGNMAMATARRRLLDGEGELALAGGSDGFSRLAFIGFMRARVMAAEVCRPFDVQRDGLLVGEGAVIFVLERESSAKARGAKIRARVTGAAMTSESYHPTRPEPNGDGLTRATKQALCDAGLEPTDVDYVCAHGTGTPHNDAIEVKVMEKCFPGGVRFSSIKALTGHTMGAAAAMEAACCVLSLEHQTLIPTWHLGKVLEPCSLEAIRGAVEPAQVRCVLNNSAGFGGYNASVILIKA
jgi:3-oxoacyl-[acyl-carrier-protein] synthase II